MGEEDRLHYFGFQEAFNKDQWMGPRRVGVEDLTWTFYFKKTFYFLNYIVDTVVFISYYVLIFCI